MIVKLHVYIFLNIHIFKKKEIKQTANIYLRFSVSLYILLQKITK